MSLSQPGQQNCEVFNYNKGWYHGSSWYDDD